MAEGIDLSAIPPNLSSELSEAKGGIPQSGPARWNVFAATGIGTFMATLDSSIVNVTLPAIAKQFQATLPEIQWVALAYMLGMASLLLIAGRLADKVGRRFVYILGMALFTLASIGCVFAHHVWVLILARLLQSIGGGLMLGNSAALIATAFKSDRGKALGWMGTVVSLGTMTGPPLGGFLTQQLSWHWIFLINLPIGIIGCLYAFKALAKLPQPKDADVPFDLLGAALSFVMLGSFMLLVTYGPQLWQNRPVGFGLVLVLGMLSTAAFWRQEQRIQNPLLHFEVFRDKPFTIAIGAAMTSFMAMMGVIFVMPFYLQLTLGYNAQEAGWMMMATTVMMAVLGPISGSLSDKMGSQRFALLGVIATLIGLGLLSRLSITFQGISGVATTWPPIAFALLFIGAGQGLFQPANANQVLGSLDKKHLGLASGLQSVMRTIGMIFGVALVGLVSSTAVHALYGNQAVGANDFWAHGFRAVILALIGVTLLTLWLVLRMPARLPELK